MEGWKLGVEWVTNLGGNPSGNRPQTLLVKKTMVSLKSSPRSLLTNLESELISTVVRRDALDPHFAANLSRLGPVTINDAGEFRPTLSSAQKTLTARQANAESTNSDIPPPGFTNAHLLSQLLDELKSVRTQNDVNRLYNHYGLDKEQMDVVRRWVNSPSVGDVNVSYAEGGEVTEMKAIWVEKKV